MQYLLAIPGGDGGYALAGLRCRLAELGDSVVVVGGDGLFAVHVHVDDVGAAVEAGIAVGTPSRITVTRFADQPPAPPAPGPPAPAPAAAPTPAAAATARVPGQTAPDPSSGRGVVAVVPGEGLRDLVRQAGARVVPAEPPPTADDLLAAVLAAGTPEVVLLPADEAGRAAAHAAAGAARAVGRTVTVVPVRSVVQSLAALAVADPSRSLADDAVAMSSAAAATRWASVEPATQRAQTSAGVCESGDVLGLVEGDVVLIGCELPAVARGLLDRLLLAGGELVTLVTAADAPRVPGPGGDADLADHLVDHLRVVRPGLDVVAYRGGALGVPLLVGVE